MPAIKKKKTEFFGFVKKNGNPFKNGKVASLCNCQFTKLSPREIKVFYSTYFILFHNNVNIIFKIA